MSAILKPLSEIAFRKGKLSDTGDVHIHKYVWDTVEATEDADGELRYQCELCADIKDRVPLTAYNIFNRNTTERIRNNKKDATGFLLKNVGIFVKDLEGAKDFFEKYFGAKVLKTVDNLEKEYYSYILNFDGQAWVELMKKPETVVLPTDPNRLGLAHICFMIDTREKLNEIIKGFKKSGYTIQYKPEKEDGPGEVRAVTSIENADSQR